MTMNAGWDAIHKRTHVTWADFHAAIIVKPVLVAKTFPKSAHLSNNQ
jgi:hypothetical protein